ncbi:MAG: phenylalanine--tRNA ligase subunit alpha [Candidatus Izemoplasmatales bacterium]|nr:phenylalanine--tRNA ligase subunit alpha [Candidatus Izemoplasmatales bacterium]
MDLKQQLQDLLEQAQNVFSKVNGQNDLQERKAEYLGKKGVFADYMAKMKDLTPEERPTFGQTINEAKAKINAFFEDAKNRIETAEINAKLQSESVDVTLPGKEIVPGRKHILTQVVEEVEDIFVGMGYTVKEGPEVESDLYNFEMLNLPKSHPARDMQDTFFITEELLLRTHTSPVQVRSLLENTNHGPLKIICPGKVYRRDDDDMTHSHQFMQIEALVVDEKARLSDLKGTLLTLAQKLFGDTREIRLRPSYFPFTEPSVEVDVTCYKCNGEGCSMCKGTGWIEILGAGMVNNAVLEAAGYDPEVYQGFALGMGVERIAILKYGIDDIRALYTNDLRFNRQFK